MRDTDFVGQWSLVSWSHEYDDGRVTMPFGDDAKGIIAYQDGRMSCVISARRRPNFTMGFMFSASQAEMAAAYCTSFAYAGTYAVVGDDVVHQVDVSTYPDWDGTAQVRASVLNGELLHLRARSDEGTPESRTALLTWRRMRPGQAL